MTVQEPSTAQLADAGEDVGPSAGDVPATAPLPRDAGAGPDVLADPPGALPSGNHRISIEISGPGRVISADGAIDCARSCAVDLPANRTIELMAMPADVVVTAVFAGWEGACRGSGACSFNVAGSARVSAAFRSAVIWEQVLERQPDVAVKGDDLYVTAAFSGIATFGDRTLSSRGRRDGVLLQLTMDGVVRRAQRFGGVDDDWGSRLQASRDGLLLQGTMAGDGLTFEDVPVPANSVSGTGRFIARLDSAGTLGRIEARDAYEWTDGSDGSLIVFEYSSHAVTKLDAGGAAVWSKPTGHEDIDITKLAAGPRGELFVSYRFRAPLSLGGMVYEPSEVPGWAVAKFTAAGDLAWTKRVYMDAGSDVRSLAVDSDGHLVIALDFVGSLRVDTHGVVSREAAADLAFVRLDGATGATSWVASVGGLLPDTTNAVAIAHDKNVAVSATFLSSVTVAGQPLKPGPALFMLRSGDGAQVRAVQLSRAIERLSPHSSGDLVYVSKLTFGRLTHGW